MNLRNSFDLFDIVDSRFYLGSKATSTISKTCFNMLLQRPSSSKNVAQYRTKVELILWNTSYASSLLFDLTGRTHVNRAQKVFSQFYSKSSWSRT